DDVERVVLVSGEDDRLAWGELGKRCGACESSEAAFADACEEWESGEHAGPVGGGRLFPAPWEVADVHQRQEFKVVHRGSLHGFVGVEGCGSWWRWFSRCAKGWWKASSARPGGTRKLIVSSVAAW